ncbi:MAG TPA: SIR2 family protein [Flavisolibacter sp.]|jgi:nucleoside-triphosphatase THEP1
MDHILNVDYKQTPRLEEVFRKIADRNTFLFLGAGASVTEEHKFLSKDIIEFYEDKKGIKWEINDIVEFVDTLISNPDYSRDEFDNYVHECLRRYKVTEAHKTLARLNWRQIITTNFDLLVEQAFDSLRDTSEQNLKLVRVSNKSEYNYNPSNDELRYIKLNGCLSDKRKYPLVFSTEDFQKASKYYKIVLNDLRNLSDQLNFLSIGYSYSDPLAKLLLEKFDSYNYRDKKWMFSVDPYIKDSSLPLFTSKRICVIRCTMDEFFQEYKKWEDENLEYIRTVRKVSFINKANSRIILPSSIQVRLFGNIEQLDVNYKQKTITDKQFYQGEEPDYTVILRHFDVIRKEKLGEVLDFLNSRSYDSDSRLIPAIFLTGAFGSGKSTFAYRLIDALNNSSEAGETLSFEVLNPGAISPYDLKELFGQSQAKRIILYLDRIELNSVFKSLLDLRNKLSIDVNNDVEIIIIATVRENILEKYKSERDIKNGYDLPVACTLNKVEAEELVERLKASGLIDYRDIKEKSLIVNKIVREYEGDSYLSLLELATHNKHIDDLLHAYNQLSKLTQSCFLYTSFLYQYRILMPAGILRSIVSMDWDEFTAKVIGVEGKGILIQEKVQSNATDPDLYFKTRHPLISRYLINYIIKNPDKKFEYYQKIANHIITGASNSRLIIDFLKAIRINNDLEEVQQNLLYDIADRQLSDDPFFLLYYAINLQSRKDEKSLLKAIEKIVYAESISTRRNHRLIHRRGSLSFDLARLYFETKKGSSEEYKVYQHIDAARDLLDIKRRLDPCSAFSYKDAIILELWCLEKLGLEPEEQLRIKIRIEELFDTASRTVFEGSEKIFELRNRYITRYQFKQDYNEYLDFLEQYYQDSRTRPYALVLKFNFYFENDRVPDCEQLLPELELLTHIKDVLRLLFKFYGMFLHFSDIRLKFFDLIRRHEELEEMDELRYYYFRSIAESYNYNFSYAFELLRNINDEYYHLNPDFKRDWIDSETEETRIFEGIIRVNNKGKKQVYIQDLNASFFLDNVNFDCVLKAKYTCLLHFYLYGIRATLIDRI